MKLPDLIVHLRNHGYADNTSLWVSWLDGVYYVDDPQTHSFKLTDGAAGDNLQMDSTVASGYVREVDASGGTTSITGLGHLEGEIVYVTSGGENKGLYTVSSGTVTLLEDVYTYQVGKLYGWKVKTMRFGVPGTDTLQSRIKKISETTVRYINSVGGKAGQEYGGTEYLTNLHADFSAEATSDKSILTTGGFDENGCTVVKSSGPYPFTGVCTIIEVDVWEP